MRSPRICAFTALAAFAVVLSACQHQYVDTREAFACTRLMAAETCHYPVYTQTVMVNGVKHKYLPYRDESFGREFWIDGMWRKADPGQPYGRV